MSTTVYCGWTPASAARATLLAATAGLPPVSLPEVLAQAALDTRMDRTYVVPATAFPALIARIGTGLRVLEVDGRRAFGYESVYFDTPDLMSYRQHIQGNRRRFKVRTRTYVDSGQCVLEVKLVGPGSATIKHRIPYPLYRRDRLSMDACRFIAGHLRGSTVGTALRPTLVTSYHRLTLVDLAGGIRITCDADLVCRTANRGTTGLGDRLAVEVKAAVARTRFDHAFHDIGLRHEPFSKYCVGTALLVGSVVPNPWYPTLRRHFGPATSRPTPALPGR